MTNESSAIDTLTRETKNLSSLLCHSRLREVSLNRLGFRATYRKASMPAYGFSRTAYLFHLGVENLEMLRNVYIGTWQMKFGLHLGFDHLCDRVSVHRWNSAGRTHHLQKILGHLLQPILCPKHRLSLISLTHTWRHRLGRDHDESPSDIQQLKC